MLKIKLEQCDITQLEVDAIVNPANSYGYMGGGIAGAIKASGGDEIEQEAVSHVPIPVGHAIITSAGNLRCRHIIHSPTMEQPAQPTNTGHIQEATHAALECADEHDLRKIAIPGMGTGIGKVPKDKAAEAMIRTIRSFKPKHLEEVILFDKNKEMVKEFEKCL